jgi:hypothetical protein
MFRQPFRTLITEAFETGTKNVICCPSLFVQQELFAKDPDTGCNFKEFSIKTLTFSSFADTFTVHSP